MRASKMPFIQFTAWSLRARANGRGDGPGEYEPQITPKSRVRFPREFTRLNACPIRDGTTNIQLSQLQLPPWCPLAQKMQV